LIRKKRPGFLNRAARVLLRVDLAVELQTMVRLGPESESGRRLSHATLDELDAPTIALRAAGADLDASPTEVAAATATANKPTPAVRPRAQVIG
jgi:hypothetical protein